MIALHHIDETIPALRPTDEPAKGLDWMETFKVAHLPVVGASGYLGLVAETTLLEAEGTDASLRDLTWNTDPLAVREDDHIFAVADALVGHDLSVLPVTDVENALRGVVTATTVMKAFAEFSMVHDPGGVLTLVVAQPDYSLSEISRIVESNHAAVLGAQVSRLPSNDSLLVTVKVTAIDLTYILASFERYEYAIRDVFHTSERGDTASDHLDALLKYIDM